MATFTNLINSIFLPGKKILGSTGMALRDNILAIQEGDPTAPKIQDAALDTGAATTAGITWVGLRVAATTVGGVGTYALMFFATATAISRGSTTAGSGLRYGNANGSSGSATAASGTWRAMGDTQAVTGPQNTTLFLRIS